MIGAYCSTIPTSWRMPMLSKKVKTQLSRSAPATVFRWDAEGTKREQQGACHHLIVRYTTHLGIGLHLPIQLLLWKGNDVVRHGDDEFACEEKRRLAKL